MKLATLTQLKAHIGIPAHDTSKDAKLNLLLDGSSAYLEGQCSRKFELQQHDIKIDGSGLDSLVLPHYPILEADGEAAITTLAIDGSSVLSSIGSTIDVDAQGGTLYRTDRVWPEGRRNIRIVFSAGYKLPGSDESGEEDAPDVPTDLALAAIRLAARVFERSSAEGVSNVSRASTNFTFKDAIDDEIKQTIARHMRIRV